METGICSERTSGAGALGQLFRRTRPVARQIVTRYRFQGVKPKFYPIPADGPVGGLLTSLGRHPNRPAHLHYILSAPGYQRLTTHIFDPDDPYIHSDAVFGVKQSLLARFDWQDVANPDRGVMVAHWQVAHDFVLAKT